MKKIIIWASVLVFSLSSLSFVNANEVTVNTEEEYGIFTDFVKKDLTLEEKNQLKESLKKREDWMPAMKEMIMDVKSWKLDRLEEFSKLVPKRKAMAENLKMFMEDKEGFEYLCMNHWDDLIASIFADENTVNRYKRLLETKYKSKLEAVYSNKGKSLEKALHMLYHKNIDDKKIKNISVIRALELIIEDIKKTEQTVLENEFEDFTPFAKKDLSDIQKEALVELLWERKAAWVKFKTMLDEAKEKGNLDETFEIIENKRTACQARFSLYLDENKKEDFADYCKKMWENLRSMYK